MDDVLLGILLTTPLWLGTLILLPGTLKELRSK
ncbi:hypothetical protein A8U91_04046 [Halomonas elongata]|uniref:Uncharacterized protein n=1 Tax=Halomonas elongata TaxID=2746 RepID=A0A1B8NYD2_HALEL|nr:hypothetical protein A8U91_04046 [Halomonas elongata]